MEEHPIKLWHDALLSGEYPQGKGYLNKNDKYCCLGVACEVAIKNGIKLKKGSFNGRISYNSSFYGWPIEIKRWLSYKKRGLIDEKGKHEHPIDLNDIKEYTFKQIAAAIKRTYPEHFPEE